MYDFLLSPKKKLGYLKSMYDPFSRNVITELLLQIISHEIKKKHQFENRS